MDINTYLERINYTGSVKLDAQTLYDLHFVHILAVPFENLDIALKRPIHINEQAVWEKIVINKRGGFCYELNGLFAWLLKQIGFDVTYLNARVFNRDGELGIHFDHLALLVQIPDRSTRWLADVGFGDSFTKPLPFEMNTEKVQSLRAYRLEKVTDGYVVWQRNYKGSWEHQYFFDLTPRNFPKEYESACLYHQKSPQSGFTRSSIISRATSDGRISLENGKLISTVNGQRSERSLKSKDEYCALLKEHFGVLLQKEILCL